MKYLQSKSGIAAGELTIKDTRIRISQIFRMLAAGQTVDDMLIGWPWMSAQTLRGAIDEALELLDASVSQASTTHA